MKPMRAKEIARATCLSVHTVNDHLKSARRKLNTTDSRVAAEMLRASESDPPRDLGSNLSGWPAPVPPGHDDDADVERRSPDILPFAVSARPWNDLERWQRIAWPLLILGVIALGAGALVAGAAALSQLVLSLAR